MLAFLLWTLAAIAAIAAVWAITALSRLQSRASLLRSLKAAWGQPATHDRDMTAIASYHYAMAGDGLAAHALDDRTWIDLNMDDVFAVLDRTQSSIGRQVLYRRLRSSPHAEDLRGFETLVDRASVDPAVREDVQVSLARLSDRAGYDLWWLAQPGMLETKPWFALFPLLAGGMLILVALVFFWPPALLLLVLGAAVSIAARVSTTPNLRLALGPMRQLGPLIAVADRFRRLDTRGAEGILGSLSADVARLGRLRRIAAWVSRDSAAGAFDLGGLVVEYLNLFFFLDGNALYFGARELAARSPELLRVIAAVGEVDGAVSIASYRAGTADWTRPSWLPPGARARLVEVRHPLVPQAVPNSIELGPPHGVIITGSNMSGKSTFLRTVAVTVVMAQTVNTCLASAYAAPELLVRSCIGRADDLVAGKSYYLVEVESVLALVEASRSPAAHLFLFDELFRGTNAVERIAAGEAVLVELLHDVGREAAAHVVIAATHDRELVDLLRETYVPYHFADTVGPDGLVFNFQLEPGPATTRNAIALLQQGGASPALVARALRRAEALDHDREKTSGVFSV